MHMPFSRIYLFIHLFTGIVGLNNIKANDYCNVILQVRFVTYMCTSSLEIVLDLGLA